MSPSMSSSVSASSLKVLITGLIQHGFRHAWGRPQGDPGLENAGNQPVTTMRIERDSTIRCIHANIRNSRQIKWQRTVISEIIETTTSYGKDKPLGREGEGTHQCVMLLYVI